MNKSKESNPYSTKTSKRSIDFTFKPHGHTLFLFLLSSQTGALFLFSHGRSISWTLPIFFPKSMAEDPWPKTNIKTNKEKNGNPKKLRSHTKRYQLEGRTFKKLRRDYHRYCAKRSCHHEWVLLCCYAQLN